MTDPTQTTVQDAGAAVGGAAPAVNPLSALLGNGQIPWLLIGGVAAAAWVWEQTQGKKQRRATAAAGLDDDEEEDEDEEADSDPVGWTDKRIGKRRAKAAATSLAAINGPISDTFIKPARLAQKGDCDGAVSLLDRQTRASQGAYGPRKTPLVRRSLKRSALLVTAKCPKEVEELLGANEELQAETEAETGLKSPASARAFVHRKQEYQFDPQKGIDVARTRGEAGRFKRKRAGTAPLEYRRKGNSAYRVINLDTGEEHEQRIPTGKPRGRPRKLK